MTKPFQPKTREEIKAEVLTNYGINYEVNGELVDKIVEDRFKDEEFKAAEKNKTAKTREMLNNMTKAKEFYKLGSKLKGAIESKQVIMAEDKAYLFSKGYSRTELRHLEKVMEMTKKPWGKALNDNSFIVFKKENDALIARRGAGLPASRGGISGQVEPDHKVLVEKFSKDLPRGFKLTK